VAVRGHDLLPQPKPPDQSGWNIPNFELLLALPFFVLQPVPQSTPLLNAVKFAMAFCTGVLSGTFGMQMLVSYGDHAVFDRGKSIVIV